MVLWINVMRQAIVVRNEAGAPFHVTHAPVAMIRVLHLRQVLPSLSVINIIKLAQRKERGGTHPKPL